MSACLSVCLSVFLSLSLFIYLSAPLSKVPQCANLLLVAQSTSGDVGIRTYFRFCRWRHVCLLSVGQRGPDRNLLSIIVVVAVTCVVACAILRAIKLINKAWVKKPRFLKKKLKFFWEFRVQKCFKFFFSFLPRDAMHPRYTSHGPLSVSVCLSVSVSVTSRSVTKTAKRRITQTTPHDSPGN